MVETADTVVPEAGGSSEFKTLRERIQAADDVRHEDVEVEAWGVTLRLFSMAGDVRARFLSPFKPSEDPGNETAEEREAVLREMTPALLIRTAYDPATGAHPQEQYRVFTDADQEWLATKDSAALELAGAVAMRLSGLDTAARKRAGKDS